MAQATQPSCLAADSVWTLALNLYLAPVQYFACCFDDAKFREYLRSHFETLTLVVNPTLVCSATPSHYETAMPIFVLVIKSLSPSYFFS